MLPAMIGLALWLGGSAQGAFGLLVLELAAIALLAWNLRTPAAPPAARQDARLPWLAAAWFGLGVLQLIPLPPALWHSLPGRDGMAIGDALLNIAPWRSLSLVPEATASALALLLVPMAVVVAAVRGPEGWKRNGALVVVASAVAQAIWGLAQHVGQAPRLYAFTSGGPTGAFANTNHLAALAVVSLPLVGALVADWGRIRRAGAARAIGLIVAILFAIVVIASGSAAMLVLFVPAALFGGVIAIGGRFARRGSLAGLVLLALLAAGLLFAAQTGLWNTDISATSRGEIWARSLQLAPHMAAGSGFGTFQYLYQLVEDPFAVTRFYVNHAHNDLLQLLIEGGLAALILLVLSLSWWGKISWTAWRTAGEADPYARAGAVVGAVLLVHSLVDFPLRTAALMALFAASLGLLVGRRPAAPVSAPSDLRPTRHLRVR